MNEVVFLFLQRGLVRIYDLALAVARLLDVLQVVDALTPLIGQQWGRLAVAWLDPRWEESPLVSLVPGQVEWT